MELTDPWHHQGVQPIKSCISITVAPAVGALALVKHGVHDGIAAMSPCVAPSDDLPVGLGCGPQFIALESDNKSVAQELVRVKRSRQTADALPQRTDLDLEGNWTNFDSTPFLMGRGGVVSVRERCPRWRRVQHPCRLR